MRQIDDASLEQQGTKRVASTKEGVRVGNLIVLAQPDREALNEYKQHLLDKSYQVNETAHFVICRQPSSNTVILMHLFKPEEVNADLICFIENELPFSGIIPTAREFGATLFAVLASMHPAPRNQQAIWLNFCLNSLNSLRDQIAHPLQSAPAKDSYIGPFAAIYRRIFELITGQSLLDVGCSFGFLPVLLAEHYPHAHITGCDNNPDAITFSTNLATATNAHSVTLTLLDVLAEDFPKRENFDTVTAIHLLEHLTEQDMPVALTHLLQVTGKRLLIAVPYEEEAQGLYGHQQVFTPVKLRFWGNWCIEQLKGKGQYWCEEVMGGMLVLERSAVEK